jgi:hypothetical protein
MVPNFLDIDTYHVKEDFFMKAMDYVSNTVGVIALHFLLVSGFDSLDEELLKYFDQHLLQSFVTWLDIHFSCVISIKLQIKYKTYQKF